MKKLVSVILALMLILSLTVPAFAAEGDPVITVPDDGHTYEVYQIFTADLLEQDGDITLTNVKWGKNGTALKAKKSTRLFWMNYTLFPTARTMKQTWM